MSPLIQGQAQPALPRGLRSDLEGRGGEHHAEVVGVDGNSITEILEGEAVPFGSG